MGFQSDAYDSPTTIILITIRIDCSNTATSYDYSVIILSTILLYTYYDWPNKFVSTLPNWSTDAQDVTFTSSSELTLWLDDRWNITLQ